MKKTLLITILGTLTLVTANGQTQPPNIGFEDWETDTYLFSDYDKPVGWNSSSRCTAPINIGPVTQSSDSYSGSSSARLETLDAGVAKANGVLTTAEEIICLSASGGQAGGMSYTDQFPDSLIGWYKYAPVNNDSAYSQIMFLANNDNDTVCFTRLDLHAAADWTRFSVAICPDATASSAEKLSLFFSSSWGDGAIGEAEIGSVLFLDDIQFLSPVGIDEVATEGSWSVYPNPVNDVLNVQVVRGKNATIEIVDVAGRTSKTETIGSIKQTVDVSDLVSGIYLYQIKSLSNEILRTGKLLVNP